MSEIDAKRLPGDRRAVPDASSSGWVPRSGRRCRAGAHATCTDTRTPALSRRRTSVNPSSRRGAWRAPCRAPCCTRPTNVSMPGGLDHSRPRRESAPAW